MFKRPSRRIKSRREDLKLDLTSVMDGIFTLVFFLLMYASFIKMFEISNDVPIISNKEPPDTKIKPLALTIRVVDDAVEVATGLPSTVVSVIRNLPEGEIDFEKLHEFLVQLKSKYPHENLAIIEPNGDLDYENLVKLMDTAQELRKTDLEIFVKDNKGNQVRAEKLFSEIIIGNIQS